MPELIVEPSKEPVPCLVCGVLTIHYSLNKTFNNNCPTCKQIIGKRSERILICDECLPKALMYAGKKSVEEDRSAP